MKNKSDIIFKVNETNTMIVSTVKTAKKSMYLIDFTLNI